MENSMNALLAIVALGPSSQRRLSPSKLRTPTAMLKR
jgi:hypothetical protein